MNFLWKERKYIDGWSLVHIITGYLFAGVFFYFDISFWPAFWISSAAFILWEVGESFFKVHEHSENRYADIVVDYIGFFLAVWVYEGLDVRVSLGWLVVLAIIGTALQTWGVIIWLKNHGKI